ncbi:molecular chaperone Hsp33 [Tindallia magadiensis]|uniref:33 kDa chaperonin n=1 Tax=Tindallia magadiensis TaxID=69895 RepID=A0A1I3FUZ8_9FIRM|nr:Hsp33 family molecular chaperone HslO [Tindallia magadiensis]SFI14882.1 molecular chaperone Hsp33 [Tindallia magadiensis]
MDKLIRVTAGDGQIRGFFVQNAEMLEQARKIHQLSPVAAAALGRSMAASTMMAQMLKGEGQKITLRINGGGPLGSILCVANIEGHVKGLVDHPQVETENLTPEKLNVGAAVGKEGEITVIKDLSMKAPYIGKYPLTNGEIAEDLTAYFLHSEQQPSSVGLSVKIDVDYTIITSGGFIIQVLPEISEEQLRLLEARLLGLPPLSQLYENLKTPEAVMEVVLEGLEPKIVEEKEVVFNCDCSRERMEEALISLGHKELKVMLEEDGEAEITCHFCNKAYQFNESQLKKLIEES